MELTKVLPLLKFSFELQHPSLEECWHSGYEQAYSLPLEANPYPAGSAEHHHWGEGWWARFYGEIGVANVKLEQAIHSLEHQSGHIDFESPQLNHPLPTMTSQAG